ncbi:MAG: hypothetical protein ACRYG4_02935 [Janthinobacterium lividum]
MTNPALDLFTQAVSTSTKIEQLLEVSRRLRPAIIAGETLTRQ